MAARNTFTFVGKIVPIKDTENFKGYTQNVYSGWMVERLRFNVVAGDDRHLVEINTGRWEKDEKNDVIRTYSKAKDGQASQPIEIPYAKRNDPVEIDKVAGYKIFTVDTDTRSNRKALEESGDTEALEKSNAKCKHFLVGSDFLAHTKRVLDSGKYADSMFRIQGNITYSYSEKTGKYYSAYEVTKIYRAEDDAKPQSDANINFYFTEGFMDKDSVEDSGKAILSGYTQFYDSKTKKDWFCPVGLVMREDDIQRVVDTEDVLSDFADCEVCKAILGCKIIDGAQKTDIKVENLDEKTQKAIRLGLMTEATAIRNAGGQMYGDRIQEIRFESIVKNSEATVYEIENLTEIPHEEVKEELPFDEDDI